ncbi:MAG: EAL domain-containing protein [Rhizobiales bacterium]|nr:EAL domain-containing protein [Hyphomicrobiales bacterium]
MSLVDTSTKMNDRKPVALWQLVMLPLISLAATLLAFTAAEKTVHQAAEQHFEYRQSQIVDAISRRMRTYESVLRGTLSFFKVDGQVSRDEWNTYVTSLQIVDSFPGIQALGYAQVVPPSKKDAFERAVRQEGFRDFHIKPQTPRDFYTAIKFISPMDERNLRAFGYDMWSEKTRRDAMSRATDTGKTMLSGRVMLVQENGEDVQHGILMYLPFYGAGLKTPTTIEARRAKLQGFVYSAFRMKDLMRGILESDLNDMHVRISAIDQDGKANLLFETDNEPKTRHFLAHAPLTNSQQINMYGQTWSLNFEGFSGFYPDLPRHNPSVVVLFCGLIITALLALLSHATQTTDRRASKLADKMTRDLDARANELANVVSELNLEIERREAVEASQKQLEERLRKQATTDYLTGLSNRAVFNDALKVQEKLSATQDISCGVLLLDLDRFKHVNDTMGHFTGDRVLCVVAERLRAIIHPPHILVRQGGDEFAILLRGAVTPAAAMRISESCISALLEPIDIDGKTVKCQTSIGVALHRDGVCDTSKLLSRADMALYQSKAAGRGCYKIFDNELEESLNERNQLEAALQGAVLRNELELYYQPKIKSHTGEIAGYEALLRWKHPTLGMVPPDRFIPLAEETTLINEIGDLVIDRACAQIAKWKQQGQAKPVAVNLSPSQFSQRDLVKRIKVAMTRHKVEASLLEIEITENVLITDFEEAVEQLRKLHMLGLRISIDDFGTGFSSLAYLHRLDVDVLKIDRSFVSSLDTSQSRSIVESILGLARNLRLEVVAEGVETVEQARFLRAHGCELMQGYLFSPALPIHDLEEWIIEHEKQPPGFAELKGI